MEIRRCLKCMHELGAEETVCPVCGRTYGSWKAEPFALKPGAILEGKYLVGEMLGQGGFGITYLGFDLLLEQKVAIKEYFPMGMVSREDKTTVVWSGAMMEKTGVQKGFDSFLKEARKMARLGGIPGVVGVKSVFIQNETAYIVMDFIEGETLLKKLEREGPMPFDTCVTLLTPIMRALAEVHQHGIIHRDISPDNIMVQPDGNLILLDMGAAKDMDIQGENGNVQSSQMVAKHGFSPIEQYGRNGKTGPWTDVYAMAATIYYCCTGKLPPSSVDRVGEDTLACQTPLTQAQFHALASCMTIQVQNRPQDMKAMLQILEKPPKAVLPKPELTKRGIAAPKWLLPVLAGIVVVCVAAAAIGIGKRGEGSEAVVKPAPVQQTEAESEPAEAEQTEPAETEPVETGSILTGEQQMIIEAVRTQIESEQFAEWQALYKQFIGGGKPRPTEVTEVWYYKIEDFEGTPMDCYLVNISADIGYWSNREAQEGALGNQFQLFVSSDGQTVVDSITTDACNFRTDRYEAASEEGRRMYLLWIFGEMMNGSYKGYFLNYSETTTEWTADEIAIVNGNI